MGSFGKADDPGNCLITGGQSLFPRSIFFIENSHARGTAREGFSASAVASNVLVREGAGV